MTEKQNVNQKIVASSTQPQQQVIIPYESDYGSSKGIPGGDGLSSQGQPPKFTPKSVENRSRPKSNNMGKSNVELSKTTSGIALPSGSYSSLHLFSSTSENKSQ